ncbi:peptide MFS transporter [Tepidibacter hydrothermalis]|uniref:Peptide MFS transporter n=1 Tax=Tepidibacter hydrothermalis TaxID=3036126 RepID=A0ABY8EKL5_9FIRM|nr:peptide MFS transporter [Tepidibacter hydrothermalis]WFD11668.1 peptide MFS transporter [Tepidibacter hydrothermalis]
MALAQNQEENVVEQSKKHPPGLYMLFFTEMWERFSYYGMRALLIMYLTTELVKGGLGIEKSTAALIYGWFTGLVYFTPIIGGYISDKYLGQRKAITIGGITMALGQVALFSQQSKTFLYLGLFLLIIGNGFFKPNISTLVGKLYPDGDKRRDAAFTIFYMGINVGAFLAPLICGTLAESTFAIREGNMIVQYGFKYGFLAAAIGMVLGQIVFNLLANKYLGDIGKAPVGIKDKNNKEKIDRPLTKKEKERTTVIFILATFVVVFWAGFEQAGSSLTIYTQDYINRNIGSFEVPVSWFQSLNPFFIVLLAPVLSKVWITLSKREQGDLKIPVKMAFGLILLGLGFLLMVGAVLQRGGSDDIAIKANMMWLVGAYLLHTLGELCLSPVGLSMVSSIAPVKYASALMGVWLLSSFVAQIVGGYIASYVEKLGHLQIFGGIAVVSIVVGLILITLNKKLVSMME